MNLKQGNVTVEITIKVAFVSTIGAKFATCRRCSIEPQLATFMHDYQCSERKDEGSSWSDLTTAEFLFQSYFGLFRHVCLYSGLSYFKSVILGLSLSCLVCLCSFSHQNRSGPPWWKLTSSPPEIQKSTPTPQLWCLLLYPWPSRLSLCEG